MKAKAHKTFFAWLILLALVVPLFADTPPMARKFDEFVYARPYSECDITARLTAFHEDALQLDPDAEAYIIFYRGRKRSSHHNHFWAKEYLAEMRGFPQNKVKAIDGGYRDDLTMELWVVPAGAKPPAPTPTFFMKKRRKR